MFTKKKKGKQDVPKNKTKQEIKGELKF